MNLNKVISFLFVAVIFVQGCGGSSSGYHEPTPEPEPEPMSIVDVAVANGSFTTLVAALEATGLDVTLSDYG